jgi:membrane-associated protein
LELLAQLFDIVLHLDRHLVAMVQEYGVWIYAILFAIIFAETGFVVTPFLPGDSLLFAAGALAGADLLDVRVLMILLFVAAVLGDAVNYSIGRYIGPRVFRPDGRKGRLEKLLNPKHLERTHEFFERHGGKAVVLARFVPIVRTFIPFVAGAGSMTYSTFAFYNVFGGALWVVTCVGAGWLFGAIPIVKDNFEIVVIGIIFVSILPMLIEAFRHWQVSRRTSAVSK